MITLAQLEAEVARRTGPYFQAAQDSSVPTSSTTIAAYMPTLKTSALLGGPENLFLLRRKFPSAVQPNWRGLWTNDNAYAVGDLTVESNGHLFGCILAIGAGSPPTPSADPVHWLREYSIDFPGTPVGASDRIRLVQSFDSSAGRVVVDRNWGTPMAPSEMAEFTHLHPDQELRVAVLAGLRRCFIGESLAVVLTSGGYADIDLTYQAPWITSPDQVVEVQYGWYKPWAQAPFKTYVQQGHVMLGNTSGSYAPANLWVTALRPAASWVNGADSTTGPVADTDQLAVDLDYAASAGHIEAWHLFPSHLLAASAGGLQATQEMAAREFTRQALLWGAEPARRIAFNEVVALPLGGSRVAL